MICTCNAAISVCIPIVKEHKWISHTHILEDLALYTEKPHRRTQNADTNSKLDFTSSLVTTRASVHGFTNGGYCACTRSFWMLPYCNPSAIIIPCLWEALFSWKETCFSSCRATATGRFLPQAQKKNNLLLRPVGGRSGITKNVFPK